LSLKIIAGDWKPTDPTLTKYAGGEAPFNTQFRQVFTATLSTHGNDAKAGIARLTSDGVERMLKKVRQDGNITRHQADLKEAYLRADVGAPDWGRQMNDLQAQRSYPHDGSAPQPWYQVKPF
jgi:hypothetical protein